MDNRPPKCGVNQIESPDGLTCSDSGTKKSKENEPFICSICEETIVESTDDSSGIDLIFCEGLCDCWLHRKRTGLVFNSIKLSDEPFL